jgi:hypothetical protein
MMCNSTCCVEWTGCDCQRGVFTYETGVSLSGKCPQVGHLGGDVHSGARAGHTNLWNLLSSSVEGFVCVWGKKQGLASKVTRCW